MRALFLFARFYLDMVVILELLLVFLLLFLRF